MMENKGNGRMNFWKNAMMGLIVGDALGLPVQFMDREEIRNRPEGPVTGMESGGVYGMPAGTWSDDSSMALCELDGIIRCGQPLASDIMERFVRWELEGAYTQYGRAFDQGGACTHAIYNYMRDRDVTTCGKRGEYANGNGALMRILPVCLFYALENIRGRAEEAEAVRGVDRICTITHNHLRSTVACRIYFFIIREIVMDFLEKRESGKEVSLLSRLIQQGVDRGFSFCQMPEGENDELKHYRRIFRVEMLMSIPERDIRSSGYVVDTIEAALWCLVTTDNYRDCVLKAVNLGDDTDTIAAIAGGIAGLYYGYDAIPEKWLEAIRGREEVVDMCERAQSQ